MIIDIESFKAFRKNCDFKEVIELRPRIISDNKYERNLQTYMCKTLLN